MKKFFTFSFYQNSNWYQWIAAVFILQYNVAQNRVGDEINKMDDLVLKNGHVYLHTLQITKMNANLKYFLEY